MLTYNKLASRSIREFNVYTRNGKCHRWLKPTLREIPVTHFVSSVPPIVITRQSVERQKYVLKHV